MLKTTKTCKGNKGKFSIPVCAIWGWGGGVNSDTRLIQTLINSAHVFVGRIANKTKFLESFVRYEWKVENDSGRKPMYGTKHTVQHTADYMYFRI